MTMVAVKDGMCWVEELQWETIRGKVSILQMQELNHPYQHQGCVTVHSNDEIAVLSVSWG